MLIDRDMKTYEDLSENQGIMYEFREGIGQSIQEWGKNYIRVIQNLNQGDVINGSLWLQNIVDHILFGVSDIIPSFGFTKKME